MLLQVRIKPRAARQIEAAVAWWSMHRHAAPGAVLNDLRSALALLAREPGLGTPVPLDGVPVLRRLYLRRTRYFVYYRVRGGTLEVISFWHERRGDPPPA